MAHQTGNVTGECGKVVIQGEIGDRTAIFADEMAVRHGVAVVSGTADMIEPPDKVVSGEFIEDAVDAFSGHGGQFTAHGGPDGIDVRVAMIMPDTFIDCQTLRSAFPLETAADMSEIFRLKNFHCRPPDRGFILTSIKYNIYLQLMQMGFWNFFKNWKFFITGIGHICLHKYSYSFLPEIY